LFYFFASAKVGKLLDFGTKLEAFGFGFHPFFFSELGDVGDNVSVTSFFELDRRVLGRATSNAGESFLLLLEVVEAGVGTFSKSFFSRVWVRASALLSRVFFSEVFLS